MQHNIIKMTVTLNKINRISKVNTKSLSMFNLHELFIDNKLVGYIRINENKIEVFVHHEFTSIKPKKYEVTFVQFKEMVRNYKKSRGKKFSL